MEKTHFNENEQDVAANKVLKNTYLLLGANLGFSALVAGVSTSMNLPMMPWYIMIPIYFLLLWGVEKTKDGIAGIGMVFALTGFLGLTLGPILNMHLGLPDGATIIAQSLLGTAIMFVGLSAYTVMSKVQVSKKFTGFIVVGILSAFVMSLLNIILFQSSIMSMVISVAFMFLSSAVIVWQTSEIVNGGEKNYISATVTLFVQLYNIFVSLLSILGIASKD